jgi:hypothetical protein
LESCSESEDCIGGRLCHPESHQCVLADALVPHVSESSCGVSRRHPPHSTHLPLLILLLFPPARRRYFRGLKKPSD